MRFIHRHYKQSLRFYSKDYLVGIRPDGSLTKYGKEHLSDLPLKDMDFKKTCRIFYKKDMRICVVGFPEENEDLSSQYASSDVTRPDLVSKISTGVKMLLSDKKDTSSVFVDDFGNTKDTATGAYMGAWKFPKIGKTEKTIEFTHEQNNGDWKIGQIFGEAQNFSKWLSETPANLMTPTIFAQTISKQISNIEIHDKDWCVNKKMNCFLAVAQGSLEPLKFIEAKHMGNKESKKIDLCLVGKGITFDSGGISLKPGASMKDMKGDMGGAACVNSALIAISKLKLPINVVAISALTENMPSGNAVKPGDVHMAMNGKTVEIDNTDAEGRLILADALSYASTLKPKYMIDVATLTGAISIALGSEATGAYSSSNHLWTLIEKAGLSTNDLMWRMPLLSSYLKGMESITADFNNIPKDRSAGSVSAAAFLKEFVDLKAIKHWGHLDIAGTMMTKGGMSGRPVRALIELAQSISQNTK
jgi:aminopeptidase